MSEPTVQVPVSLIDEVADALSFEERYELAARVRALLSQPTPSAEHPDPYVQRYREVAAAPPSIADMAPGTRITGRSTVTGIWVQATVETGGTLIIGDTHWGASVLDPSTIRDVKAPE